MQKATDISDTNEPVQKVQLEDSFIWTKITDYKPFIKCVLSESGAIDLFSTDE